MDTSKIRIIGKGVEPTESDMAQVYALAIKLLSAKLSGKVVTLESVLTALAWTTDDDKEQAA